VITNISLEHQDYLGPRLLDIAGEKAGIVKRGIDLVTGATQAPVIELFRSVCQEKKAPFWRVGEDVRYRSVGSGLNYYGLHRTLKDLHLELMGRHQYRNAAMALAVMELLEEKGFRFSSHDIREGLRRADWPGRLQIISRRPDIILDGAHNPAAIRTLAKSIRHDFEYRRMILVLGVMGDKDIKGIVQGIVPLADYVVFTRPDYYRSADPEVLMREAAPLGKMGEILPAIPQAIDKARKIAHPQDIILVCGSLFTVGEALPCLDPRRYRPDDV
jgi:dihydrofolate synthase/folylpolyglutamate synthase